MSLTLKSLFKKQMSWSVGHKGGEDGAKRKSGEDNRFLQRSVSEGGHDHLVALRKKQSRRRHESSLGALEDIIKCPICKQIIKSPRTLACQHTFCKSCLEVKLDNQFARIKESTLNCPICKAPTRKIDEPDALPINESIEKVLRAMSNDNFIETTADKSHGLIVNFAPLTSEYKLKNHRCARCDVACSEADVCSHCKKIFCTACHPLHVAQLKDELSLLADQLQSTIDKLDLRVVEFKDAVNSMRSSISQEYDARAAALRDERARKMAQIDEFRLRGESSAEEARRCVLDSQTELIRQRDQSFDEAESDGEKIDVFVELRRKASETITNALSRQNGMAMDVDDVMRRSDEKGPKATSKQRVFSKGLDLHRPSGLAYDSFTADVYLACPGNAQLVVFDRYQRAVRKIQSRDAMVSPQAVAVLEARREVFVTDKWKNQILVFNTRGDLLRTYGERGSDLLEFRCPEGIAALQSRDLLYIADTGNQRVQIIDAEGNFRGGIGRFDERFYKNAAAFDGMAKRQFALDRPTDVAVSDNAVVVADAGEHKVKVFNRRGQMMFSIGGLGTFKGFLKSPEIVKLDANGNMYVGDCENGRVQVFSNQGAFLRSFGAPGEGINRFGWISGLVCLPSNEVLVADCKNNTLQVF